MKRLAPDFFNRRFDALVEGARSRLPSLAPRWTDYNAHDPGITLLELLAYVAEAQMYSLSRMRRDERAGYAALLGLRRQGPRPASGNLWPDRGDPDSPFRSYHQPVIIEPDALVRTERMDSPPFHPTHRILWTAGNVTALRALLADGRVLDLTQMNVQGNRSFEPFGPAAAADDVLRLEYSTLGKQGLFPARRALAAQAYWPIGVRVAPALHAVADEDGATPSASRLAVEMVIGGERIELPVVADGTRGFMQSGVLLLDLGNVPEAAGPVTQFALEIRAPHGFARPPRVLALEPGVLPIEQGGMELGQPHAATGVPNQRIELAVPGLRFGEGVAAPRLVIKENGEIREWHQVDDLEHSGPADLVYELDTDTESVYLGNGINGHLPETGSEIAIDYAYCSGAAGNTPRRQHWAVSGIRGNFGLNPDPIAGGGDADSDIDLRRKARIRLRAEHALVTAADIAQAALDLPDLEVARAEVILPRARPDATRELTLVALRARANGEEPAQAPETARWLAAVRRALLPRMPLGTRLDVRAPDYRAFSLSATLEAMPRRDPADIEAAVRQKLREGFALTPRPGIETRPFGASVTTRDVAALIRRVPGVKRVSELTLRGNGNTGTIRMSAFSLPRLDLAGSSISVLRAGAAGAP